MKLTFDLYCETFERDLNNFIRNNGSNQNQFMEMLKEKKGIFIYLII